MTRKHAINSDFQSALLLGLAVLASSCTTTPQGSGQKADASSSTGGNPTESSGLGGQSGQGSGGTVASGGTAGSAGTASSAGGMASGGQAGSAGRGGSGAGGSASGGAGAADAATNRDTAADLPTPDAPAKDAATDFWTTSFVANCTPPAIGGRPQSDGHHRAGEDCMQSGCHLAGSPDAGVPFLFGGTVRRAGSLATYPSVEVAVKTPSEFYAACSASNGNFWIVAANAGSLDWNQSTARVRTSNGETAMLPAPEAACNSCHSEILLLTAP